MNFRNLRAQLDGVFSGSIYALLIIVIGLIEDGPPADDLMLRAFFGFVLGVLSKAAIDGAMIDLASDNPTRFARYHFGFAMGAMWGVGMILAFWPLIPAQFVVWVIGSVFFGTVMAKVYRVQPVAPERLALYDVSKDIYAGRHPAWRIVPAIMMVTVLGAALFAASRDNSVNPYFALGLTVALVNNDAPYVYKHRGLKAFQLAMVPIAILAGYLTL